MKKSAIKNSMILTMVLAAQMAVLTNIAFAAGPKQLGIDSLTTVARTNLAASSFDLARLQQTRMMRISYGENSLSFTTHLGAKGGAEELHLFDLSGPTLTEKVMRMPEYSPHLTGRRHVGSLVQSEYHENSALGPVLHDVELSSAKILGINVRVVNREAVTINKRTIEAQINLRDGSVPFNVAISEPYSARQNLSGSTVQKFK